MFSSIRQTWKAPMAHRGEIRWQGGVCTMTMNIDEGLTQTELMVGCPMFIVSGDWIFNLA